MTNTWLLNSSSASKAVEINDAEKQDLAKIQTSSREIPQENNTRLNPSLLTPPEITCRKPLISPPNAIQSHHPVVQSWSNQSLSQGTPEGKGTEVGKGRNGEVQGPVAALSGLKGREVGEMRTRKYISTASEGESRKRRGKGRTRRDHDVSSSVR